MIIKTKPEPYCPECGAKMILRRPRGNQEWRPFWGCSEFPDCYGTRQIDQNGEPEEEWPDLSWGDTWDGY